MRVRLAWVLFGLTVLVAVVHVALLIASDRAVLDPMVVANGFPLVTLGAVAGAGIGALILSRYPGHAIGWLFVIGQLLSELGLALRAYGYSAISGELGSAPGGHLANWLGLQAGGTFVITLLCVLFLLAPDGNLLSPRWRWAMALPMLSLTVYVLALASVSPADLDPEGDLVGEPGPVLLTAVVASSVALALAAVAAAASLILRLRRAGGEERQQLRWMVLAAVGLALGIASNFLLEALSAPEWLAPQGLMLAYACVPVFTGIAILRYRLYDIDVFLNRAITLAVLTGVVAVGYVAVVVTIGTLFPLIHGAFWPSLITTALVALAVQPLRKWVERLADRLVYGKRAAPYEELAEFSEKLQESPGTEELLRRLGEAVAHAVGARHVSIALGVPARGAAVVGWPQETPPRSGSPVVTPVVDEDGQIGELTVTMPLGVDLRPGEERLLSDFAVQLGHAFRRIELESELVERVEQLRESTLQLEASARRLDDAQNAERERFEADLARTVVPHLVEVGQGLEQILADNPTESGAEQADSERRPDGGQRPDIGARLDQLSRHTQAALDSLRTLTRGVFPSLLSRRGLVPALAAHLEESGDTSLHADPSTDRRFEPQVESTAYFCAVAFLRQVEGPIEVRLTMPGEILRLEVSGRSPVPAPPKTEHLHDRAAALGGTATISAEAGRALLLLELPLVSSPDAVPHAAQTV